MATLHYKGSVFAELPAYTRVFNSSVFSRADNAPESDYDFTTSAEIKLTDDALKKLNYPNHLATQGIPVKYSMYLVQRGGGGALPVTVIITKISTETRTCTLSIIGSYGGYANIVGQTKLTSLALGGVRSIGHVNGSSTNFTINSNSKFNIDYYGCDDVATFITSLMDESVTDDYVFFQGMDEKKNIPGLDEDTTRHILNRWAADGIADNSYSAALLIDPVLTNIKCALNNTDFPDRYFWVPYFRLIYVMKCCFEEFGFSVESELLTDDKFKRISLYNTYHINKCTVSEAVAGANVYTATITHDATTITGGNHMPDMTILDFLWHVGIKFNLRYIIDFASSKVFIQKLDHINISSEILDISGISDPHYEVNNENPLNYTNGYKLGYTFDPNDEAQGASVNDDITTNPANIIRPVATYTDMLAMVTTGFTNNDFAYVKSDNTFYNWSGDQWTFAGDNLQARTTWKINNDYVFYAGSGTSVFPTGDPEEITTKVVPMPMKNCEKILVEADAGSNDAHILMPVSGIGMGGDQTLQIFKPSNLSSGDGHDFLGTFLSYNAPRISIMPHLCNYIGMQSAHFFNTGLKFPCGSMSGYTINNAFVDVYTLSWAGPFDNKGIYFNFFSQWVYLIRNSFPIDNNVLLDALTFSKLDPNGTIIKKDGQSFIVWKGEINEAPAVSKLTLVRI